MNCSSSISRFY